jgi:hypothetical protein
MPKARRHAQVQASVRADLTDDLEEISSWLGTYKERLRRARAEEREGLVGDVRKWDDRLAQRRAELA